MLVSRCSIFTWLCRLNPVPYSASKWPFTFGQETTKYELSFLLERGWVSLHNLVKKKISKYTVRSLVMTHSTFDGPWLRLHPQTPPTSSANQCEAMYCNLQYYNLYTKPVTGACDSVSLTSFENWMLLSTCFTKKLTVSTITVTGTIPGLCKWPCQHNLSSTSR